MLLEYVKSPGRERAGEFKEIIGGKADFSPLEEGDSWSQAVQSLVDMIPN